ncbi:MAG TPA: DAK2 domain-containing protein [Jatrophihabitans sp.]|nr:DAK2 domain-containing protein [Jatrophihabitans sp.]
MLDALDADAVRAWSRSTVELIDAHRAEMDALNVFPVPDADTGANLLATLRAADRALDAAAARGADAALAALAEGAAVGALGNSGFIVSQVLRGMADAAAGQRRCDGRTVAIGLDRGATLARAAVVEPVEGTVLTVARAAADAARGPRLADVVIDAMAAADAALQRTPTQLRELAEAGVVDAGGRGLVIMLTALARTVTGTQLPITPVRLPPCAPEPSSTDRAFEVQYRLDAAAPAIADLRVALAAVGDSVAVVATGEQAWNVHVHVDDVGAAIEAGLDVGRPHQISVVPLPPRTEVPQVAAGDRAVFAVAPGIGLAHLFEREGVHVVAGGTADLPAAADVIAAIGASGARDVVLLSNADRVTGVAEAAAAQLRETGIRVEVVPIRSAVQGLAAIAVHDRVRRFDDDVVAMAEAAAATRHAELVVVDAPGLTAVGICQPGDILGLIDGEVVEIGRGLLAVAFNLVDRLLRVGAELMTIVVGADAPASAGELLRSHVRSQAPLTDVAVYAGGQRDHPVIIGVE